MKILFASTLFVILLWSCASEGDQTEKTSTPASDPVEKNETIESSNENENILSTIKMGMTEAQVKEILGEPTKVEAMQSDKETVIEDWWFGDNTKIRMMNKTVNRVTKDVGKETEIFKKIIEAKKNKDEAEVQRLMEELTND